MIPQTSPRAIGRCRGRGDDVREVRDGYYQSVAQLQRVSPELKVQLPPKPSTKSSTDSSTGSTPVADPYPTPSSIAPTGSRVRIHGLEAKPEYNGRDGRVVSIDETTGRVNVTLEAHTATTLRVKPENMSPSPFPATARVAQIDASGHLLEHDGRCLNETLNSARFAVNDMNHGLVKGIRDKSDINDLQHSQEGFQKLMYLNKRMYSEWTTGTLPDGKFGGVFHYLRASGEFSVESFPADNGPDTPIPDLLTSILAAWSVEKEQDVARWGDAASRRYGTFFVVEDTNTGAVLVDKRDGAVYKVFGIKDTLCGPLLRSGAVLPMEIQTTLLPFRGRIVYDGVSIAASNGIGTRAGAASVDAGVARMLRERVRLAQDANAVVTNLSHHGPLHLDYDQSSDVAENASTESPTPELLALANQLTQMKKAFPKGAPHMLTIDYLPAQLKVAAAFAAVAGSGPGNAVTCGYYPPPSAEETDEAKRTGIRF